jgi:hypothetical protein
VASLHRNLANLQRQQQQQSTCRPGSAAWLALYSDMLVCMCNNTNSINNSPNNSSNPPAGLAVLHGWRCAAP